MRGTPTLTYCDMKPPIEKMVRTSFLCLNEVAHTKYTASRIKINNDYGMRILACKYEKNLYLASMR